jgi:hypothetical protein
MKLVIDAAEAESMLKSAIAQETGLKVGEILLSIDPTGEPLPLADVVHNLVTVVGKS